jgi:RNA polymerase sigma-70 factor, ECF subfamily
LSPDDAKDLNTFLTALPAARGGSADALGRLLMGCREYLLLVANRELQTDLQVKVAPSDLVQETFLEAQRDFQQFNGSREEELLAWLRRILLNNLANANRHYRGTEMRALDREVVLAAPQSGEGPAFDIAQDSSTASKHVASREQAAALETALASLPENYRTALKLRYQDGLAFGEIGAILGCSAEAARKLWARGVDRLRQDLDLPDDP